MIHDVIDNVLKINLNYLVKCINGLIKINKMYYYY